MPKGDGTGPPGGGAQRGARMKGIRAGAGPVGTCVCPGCGERISHRKGIPCYSEICPKCGMKMVRE